ncbi:Nif3-like dinuclear metal center hexameric protein [Spiribacter sp. 2438]|uniref:Nif3-like dinuclear metal center hexameric protein n=1 Tax=Spiribacter sp. 2438 TaxID=2666185 RepID=UPI0012AEE415|nr:Nif3-like dinuclear metal center hexameric protein [Spiribacter sp. 2438]QGM22168.1 Nif3-like dinuclear metal center hexameric protein [Spiribacter sp. 2438]
MVHRSALTDYLHERLSVAKIADYCPNGLQVEGRANIQRLVTGVTASKRFLDAAIDAGADAVLVHHGYFWKGESPCLTGAKAERIRCLLRNDISLLAYHLPLDVHAEWGNNACLARLLDISVTGQVDAGGVEGLLWHGQLAEPLPVDGFVRRVALALDRPPLMVGEGPERVQRVAWCSGGGQGFISAAADLGVDLYLSGEISEPTTHLAREAGMHYLAAGHHATERGGVQALGEHLAEAFGLEHRFIDDPNPA